ncbi:MAG TPA: DNA-binding domain-containing protein [Verrucomicrobiales bacterium]|nr:DNA-binding domain-containing protein [Verrucomicrobiales bacterium]
MNAGPHSSAGATADSTQLEKMQRWFQAVISHPEGVAAGAAAAEGGEGMIEANLTRSNALDAADRLSVYADAYFARLIECMGEVFPMIKKFLGAETFDAFAFDYLQAIPSRSYTLHHLGQQFPAWLENSRPQAEEEAGVASADEGPDWPELLVDLARMEWIVYETFDGPGMEGKTALSAEALGRLPAEAWDKARLVPGPALSVAAFRFPVNGFYTALRQAGKDESATPPDAEPSWVAFNRRDFVVHRYELSESAHALLTAVIQSKPLAEALDEAAGAWPGADDELGQALQKWFQDWAEGEFFSGIESTDPGTA